MCEKMIYNDEKWILYINKDGSYKYKVNIHYSGYANIANLYMGRSFNPPTEIYITTVIHRDENGFIITFPLPYIVSIFHEKTSESNGLNTFRVFITNHENVFISLKLLSSNRSNILENYELTSPSNIYMKHGEEWNIVIENSIRKITVIEDRLSISTIDLTFTDELYKNIQEVFEKNSL
jgi:hypothetical protein